MVPLGLWYWSTHLIIWLSSTEKSQSIHCRANRGTNESIRNCLAISADSEQSQECFLWCISEMKLGFHVVERVCSRALEGASHRGDEMHHPVKCPLPDMEVFKWWLIMWCLCSTSRFNQEAPILLLNVSMSKWWYKKRGELSGGHGQGASGNRGREVKSKSSSTVREIIFLNIFLVSENRLPEKKKI